MTYKKLDTAKQLKYDLENGKLNKQYLFLGPEEGEKEKYIKKISAMIYKDELERKEATGRFHIEQDEFMAAADYVLSQSMFVRKKICIILNISSLQYNKKHQTVLEDILYNSPTENYIIMTDQDNKIPKVLQPFKEKYRTIQFWKYFDRDMYNYISIYCKQNGLQIDEKAIAYLIEVTGKDIKKIDDTLDMITLSGVTTTVSIVDIKNLTFDLRDIALYEFIDLLFKKQKKALYYMKKMLEDGQPELSILSRIILQLSSLENYYQALHEGLNADEAMKKCGVYERNKQNFLQYSNNFTLDKINKSIYLVSKADKEIKSKSYSHETIANPLFNLVAEMVLET